MFKVDSKINLIILNESLAENLFELVESDREYLNVWLPWPPSIKKIEDTKLFIKNSIDDFIEGKSMVCAIEYQKQIVGVVSYNKILKSLKKVEIGYWLSSKYQGNGIITKSVEYLIKFAFDKLEMKKVQIAVAAENLPSQKVCKRLGLKSEAVVENSENLHGKFVDHIIYSIFK